VGLASAIQLDPNLRNSFTNEFSTWLERDLGKSVGARVGFVMKMDRDGYHQANANRPVSAWNVPTTVADLGVDGLAGTGDDRTLPAFGLNATAGALPTINRIYNPDGYEANYKTIEVGATKRYSRNWNLVSSFSITWTDEFGTSYFGSGPGANLGASGTLFGSFATTGFPVTPNGQTERTKFSQWNFKVHGTYAPGWGVRITPVFRIQQGYPYGRVFTANVAGAGITTVSQNFMAEPVTSHRHDTIKQLDFRAEKKFNLTSSGRAKLGVIFDLYNVFNANTVLNLNARTGRLVVSETAANVPIFGSPVTILPPRIARFSARLEW
jgi:hypothetical protein